MSIAPLPDARASNWVDRFAPRPLRPWLKLGRFDRPAGVWLLMLPGWQGVALASAMDLKAPDWLLLVKIALGAVVMRAAGCAYNDIVDRDIDAQVARTAGRPIPSGQISVRQAWIFVIALSLIGLAILLTLTFTAILLGLASLALVAAYPFMKRITWWPQAWLGLTFNWGALMGYAAVAGGLAPPTLVLYAAGVCWTLGYDTIYAHQDKEDDARIGVKSSALALGEKTRPFVFLIYGAAVALWAAAGWAAGLSVVFLIGIALAAAQLFWQAARVDIDDPIDCLRKFRSNRAVGWLVLTGIVAGHLI